MLYHLFQYLEQFNIPGARLADYLTFRSGVALILSIFIATVIGRRIIDRLQKMQVGEIVRDLDLEGQMKKTEHRPWAVSSSSFPSLFQASCSAT